MVDANHESLPIRCFNYDSRVKKGDRFIHPRSYLERSLPKKFHPYVNLIRLDRPTGAYLLLWPCYWSIALATPPGSVPHPSYLALFGAGAFLMRSSGVIINDMVDRKFDGLVERTKSRPLASGSVSMLNATMLLSGTLYLSLLILLQFDKSSIMLGAASIPLVIAYPYFKRYTNWPQLVLGITFNWGALLGWSAVTSGELYFPAVVPLYFAGICWTLIYDTIYAHQDKLDDKKLKLKSTALHFGDDTKLYLSRFSVAMVSFLTLTGMNTNQTWPYYVSLLAIGGQLYSIISSLHINNHENCWKKFQESTRIGVILFIGIFVGTLFKPSSSTKNQVKDEK